MEDYYKILNVDYNSTKDEIIENYEKLMVNYKIQPFITENDKTQIKLIKKAHLVLTNDEYKKTYDTNLKLKQKHNENQNQNQYIMMGQHTINNKKGSFNNSYIADRIFSMHGVNNSLSHVEKSEMLRPRNVGLSSDIKLETDTPLDFQTNPQNEILPFDYSSMGSHF